jgi:hypothetical protein
MIAYYSKNKDKLLEYSKQYYLDNRETIIDKTKQYRKDNLDNYKKYQKQYQAAYRAAKKQACENAIKNIYKENGTRLPNKEATTSEKAISVAIGMPHPCA